MFRRNQNEDESEILAASSEEILTVAEDSIISQQSLVRCPSQIELRMSCVLTEWISFYESIFDLDVIVHHITFLLVLANEPASNTKYNVIISRYTNNRSIENHE